jgi:phosphonate transport system substrate-binding protein
MKPFLFLTFVLFFSLSSLNASKKLTIGFLPYLSADELLTKYTPLANYLEKKLDRKVEIIISKDYNDHIKRVGEDKYDISFLGGIPYIKVTQQYGFKPLIARYEFHHEPTFGSIIFTTKDSLINSLDDLQNRSIAFGSEQSTLSTIVPLFMLYSKGISLEDFQSYTHMSNHENVLYGVLLGDYDAGAVAKEVFNENNNGNFKIIESSKQISTHLFVASNKLEKQTIKQIKKLFLDLSKEPFGDDILQFISPSLTGFVDLKDSDYDLHRQIIQTVEQQRDTP